MRRIIDGLRYDTNADDVERVGGHEWNLRDFDTFAEFFSQSDIGDKQSQRWAVADLYRTASGRFFMTGRSLYEHEQGDLMVVLTKSEALAFCEKYLDATLFEDIFEGLVQAA